MEQIEMRLEEISKELEREDITNDEVRSLEEEVNSLEEKRKNLIEAGEKRKETLAKVVTMRNCKETVSEEREERKMEKENIYSSTEYRSAYLKNLMGLELNEAEQRAMTTVSAKAVPTSTADRIISVLREQSDILNDVDMYYGSGYLKVFLKKTLGEGKEEAEGADLTSQDFELTPVELTPKEVTEYMKITGALNKMSIDDFENKIVEDIAGGIAKKLERKVFAVMNSVTTSVVGEVNEANVFELYGKLKTSYARNAKFYMNRYTKVKVMAASNKSKNDLYLDGKILGTPVSETDCLADGVILYANAKFIPAEIDSDVTIEKDRVLSNNTHEWLGTTLFDCQMGIEEAIVKLAAE